MNAIFLIDRDAGTELSEDLKKNILGLLKARGHDVALVELGRNDVYPCLGCFRCMTENPGICVNKDIVSEIKCNSHKYDMTIYLSPVIFGHFSSTIKNAMDRATGSCDLQVMIGYGSDIDDEEKSTFIDIVARHMGAVDIVHPGMVRQADAYVSISAADNEIICEKIKNCF